MYEVDRMVEKMLTNNVMIVHPLGILVEIMMVALLIVGGTITIISIILR